MLTSQIKDEFDAAGHTADPDHLLNETGSGVRLDPFSVSLAMYRRALQVGGKIQ